MNREVRGKGKGDRGGGEGGAHPSSSLLSPFLHTTEHSGRLVVQPFPSMHAALLPCSPLSDIRGIMGFEAAATWLLPKNF